MAKKRKFLFSDPSKTRWLERESQTSFWGKFGVGQSSGCRYENGRQIPEPTAILISLYYDGVISDEDLKKARDALPSSYREIQTRD